MAVASPGAMLELVPQLMDRGRVTRAASQRPEIEQVLHQSSTETAWRS